MQLSGVGATAYAGRADRSETVASRIPRSETLRVAQMNLYNFFDTELPGLGAGNKLPTAEQYATKLAKTAMAINKLGLPDVISINEVENEGVLRDLANSDALKGAGYAIAIMPTNDVRGINVAVMYKKDKLEQVGAEQFNPKVVIPNDGGKGHSNAQLLYARAPLLVDFRMKGAAQAADGAGLLTVVTNHFKSKIDTSKSGDVSDRRRALQGEHLAAFLDERAATKPSAATIVVGDLNSSYGETAYEKLAMRADGTKRFHDAPLNLPVEERYTYIYRKQRDMLDHLMVSAGKADAITGVKILRLATPGYKEFIDNPRVIKGFSDHDPLYVDFSIDKLMAPETPAPKKKK